MSVKKSDPTAAPAAAAAVQCWLGRVKQPVAEKGPHLKVEEGQQQ